MASASKYTWQRSDGSTGKAWRAKYVGRDRRVHYKRGFRTKGEAVAYATDREAEARHGVALEPTTSGMTLTAWSEKWRAGLRVRPSTQSMYDYALKRILADLGHRPIASLRRQELIAWRAEIGDRYADSTARLTASVLGMILRAAVEDDLLTKNPMPSERGSTSRQVDPDELLTLDQIRRWGEAMPAVGRALPLIAAQTGLRQGELLGLRVPNVDFLRREVRVVEQMVTPPSGGGQPDWGPPKTRAGRRTVPLPAESLDALAQHIAAFPSTEGEPIFLSTRGRRWRRSSFGEVWRSAAKKADLPAWAHWHGLRDVYASTLLRQGVDAQTLIGLMGHTSLDETRVYARLWGDSRDRARRQVDAAWAPAGDAEDVQARL